LGGGDEAEFADMVRRQTGFVFRVAYAVLRNPADAEDAAQETFLKLFRNGGWRRMEEERAFLARAAWRMAQDWRERRSRAGGDARAEESFDDVAERVAAEGPDPERAAMEGSGVALVHRMIAALPEELRGVLVMASLEGMNSGEVGRALGIPEGTVRTRLQRARQMLKEKLAAMDGAGKEGGYARTR